VQADGRFPVKRMRVKIGDREVGNGAPCFIIAEAGVNHNGDPALAGRLIDVAKEAGADAVKFQTFTADSLVTRNAEKADYQRVTTVPGESQYDMIRGLELTRRDFRELSEYARELGIVFLSSPFDEGSADFLETLDIAAYKIPSGEITNLPLLGHIGRKGRPAIVSTGMADLAEISDAVSALRSGGLEEIILLHCVTSYPAPFECLNLKAMGTLRDAFRIPVGFSDHAEGILSAGIARALGACVIEKHFTMSRDLPGPDHRASLEPDELRSMVEMVHRVDGALGTGIKEPVCGEQEMLRIARKSLVARVDIPKGTVISGEMIGMKRPGTGIPPKEFASVIGRRAARTIRKDELIGWHMIQ
jgi:N-acetylneuraminate synthase